MESAEPTARTQETWHRIIAGFRALQKAGVLAREDGEALVEELREGGPGTLQSYADALAQLPAGLLGDAERLPAYLEEAARDALESHGAAA